VKLVLNVAAASWLGGRYYLENLARSLGSLEADERPVVVSLGDGLAATRAVAELPEDADVVFPNWALPRRRGRRPPAEIHWIPDLQHRRLPENFGRLERLRRDVGYRRLIDRAELLVVSSDAVAADVRRAYRPAAAKTRVVRFRTVLPPETFRSGPEETVARLGLPERYVLLPNQWWAHKNHATALAALADLPLPVVCTGEVRDTRRPGFADELLRSTADARAAGRLHVLGVVDRADYLQLVRSAAVVLQPSLFEGWSSVVEDARAFGVPVALSDIDVHREQDPPCGHFFQPHDPAGLAAAVASALDEPRVPEAEAIAAQELRVREYAAQFTAVAREARSAL
jgi:glycosyltransferase involved in cell wall biosynthesis